MLEHLSLLGWWVSSVSPETWSWERWRWSFKRPDLHCARGSPEANRIEKPGANKDDVGEVATPALTGATVLHVDGNNNVIVELSGGAFLAAGVEPRAFQDLVASGAAPSLRVKVGAAGARLIGAKFGIGEKPREWRRELPVGTDVFVAAAVPLAQERIEVMRRNGLGAPWVVYSNDLARVEGEDPEEVSRRFRASAGSGREYERLVEKIKSDQGSVEDTSDRLAEVILLYQPPAGVVTVDFDLFALLAPLAKRFVVSAEAAAQSLKVSHDWSPAIIGLCKAVELEAVGRLIEPLKAKFLRGGMSESDLRDNTLRRTASYCNGRTDRPPELGTIAWFMRAALESGRRESSALLQSCYRMLSGSSTPAWLTDPDGAAHELVSVAQSYRNPAVHIESMSRQSFLSCRSVVLGEDGLLHRLALALPDRLIAA
jgi:hypothetical protein